jgi:hypothetical protein
LAYTPRGHVPADRNAQSQQLDRKAAKDESRPRNRIGKEHQSGYCKKESGRHRQQSSVFHLRSFPGGPKGGLHSL